MTLSHLLRILNFHFLFGTPLDSPWIDTLGSSHILIPTFIMILLAKVAFQVRFQARVSICHSSFPWRLYLIVVWLAFLWEHCLIQHISEIKITDHLKKRKLSHNMIFQDSLLNNIVKSRVCSRFPLDFFFFFSIFYLSDTA